MSRIQAAYDVLARELRESEKPAVAAFEAKYAHALNPHGPAMAVEIAAQAAHQLVYIFDSGATLGYDVVPRNIFYEPKESKGSLRYVSDAIPKSYGDAIKSFGLTPGDYRKLKSK